MQEQSAVSPEDPSDTSLSCSEFLSSLQLTWVLLQSKYLYTATKCGTEPIRYVIHHFQDCRGTVSLYYRNHTKITVLIRGLVFGPAQELQLYPWVQWEQETIKGVYLIINLYINNNNDSRYNNNKNNDTNKSYWLMIVDHEIPKVTTLYKSRLIHHKLGKNIIVLI